MTSGVVRYNRHHPFEGNSGRRDAVVVDAVDGRAPGVPSTCC